MTTYPIPSATLSYHYDFSPRLLRRIFWHGVLFERRMITLETLWWFRAAGWMMAPRPTTGTAIEVWKRVG